MWPTLPKLNKCTENIEARINWHFCKNCLVSYFLMVVNTLRKTKNNILELKNNKCGQHCQNGINALGI